MTPNEIFFGLITAAIIALVIFLIWMIIRLVDTLRTTKLFIQTADQALQQGMGELNLSLRSLRTITDNMGTVTDDLRHFSSSVKDVGNGVKQVTGNVKRVSDMIGALGTESVASVCGVRAGIKTGVEALLKGFFQQRTGKAV
jgi:uncharacterized protein YoxC